MKGACEQLEILYFKVLSRMTAYCLFSYQLGETSVSGWRICITFFMIKKENKIAMSSMGLGKK